MASNVITLIQGMISLSISLTLSMLLQEQKANNRGPQHWPIVSYSCSSILRGMKNNDIISWISVITLYYSYEKTQVFSPMQQCMIYLYLSAFCDITSSHTHWQEK